MTALETLRSALALAHALWINQEAHEAILDAIGYCDIELTRCVRDIGPDDDPDPQKIETGSW